MKKYLVLENFLTLIFVIGLMTMVATVSYFFYEERERDLLNDMALVENRANTIQLAGLEFKRQNDLLRAEVKELEKTIEDLTDLYNYRMETLNSGYLKVIDELNDRIKSLENRKTKEE